MVKNQARSNRKPSGARYKKQFVRRQHEAGREPALTKIDSARKKSVRTLGGNRKHKALSEETVQVVDPSNNKRMTATMTSVQNNPANRHFIRRNIVTKGAIVETDKGQVEITNRPGQTGIVQGILVK